MNCSVSRPITFQIN